MYAAWKTHAVVHFLCLTKLRLVAKAEAHFSRSNIFTITHSNKTRKNNNFTKTSNTLEIKTERLRRSERTCALLHGLSIDCTVWAL